MAVVLVVKQGDTFPGVETTLTDSKGAINLTEATSVKFIAKSGSHIIEGNCTIIEAGKGTVSYPWAEGDTGITGVYKVEYKITWKSGGIQSVPNQNYDEIEIEESL
jgi:hypothetical protein